MSIPNIQLREDGHVNQDSTIRYIFILLYRDLIKLYYARGFYSVWRNAVESREGKSVLWESVGLFVFFFCIFFGIDRLEKKWQGHTRTFTCILFSGRNRSECLVIRLFQPIKYFPAVVDFSRASHNFIWRDVASKEKCLRLRKLEAKFF